MNAALAYVLARLGEPSTYRGIFALLTALGIALKPEQAAAITSVGLALIGAVNVFKKDAVKLIPLALCCLLLPSCSTVNGEKTFLGITSAGWLDVGKDAGNAALKSGAQAAVISYGERRAVTAAKNPVNVTP